MNLDITHHMEKTLKKSYIYIFFMIFTVGCANLVSSSLASDAKTAKVVLVKNKTKSLKTSNQTSTIGTKKETSKKQKGMDRIKDVLNRYRINSGITMVLKKNVYLSLLDETKKYLGTMRLSKGRLVIEINKPTISKIFVNGTNIWLENRLGKNIQVSKILSKNQMNSKGLIGLFFAKSSLWEGYQLVKATTKDRATRYTVIPKPNNKKAEAKKVEVVIVKSQKEILELSYWDELDNKTSFLFSNSKFNRKLKSSLFEYVPPANAEITSY